jgi:opine dehydrogenase
VPTQETIAPQVDPLTKLMNEGAKKPKFCVLGAGHGGTAMAAHIAHMGFDVSIYNRSSERIVPIQLTGGIELLSAADESLPTGFVAIKTVTADIEEALEGVDIMMVVVPATGHAFMAEKCAPHLRDGHIIVLHPGRTGGALEFNRILQDKGVTADVIVAEAQTLIYASRCVNPAQVTIFRVKNTIPVAAIPAYRTPEVVRALRIAFPQFVPGDNVMKTSMDNIGSVFHPAITVLNAARIESTRGNFEYYIEGVTPSVGLVLEKLDTERVTVAEAMGFRAMTAREWLYIAYDVSGRSLFEAINSNPGYYGIRAPHSIYHRYLTEDVPMSLVPISSMGNQLDVPTPMTDNIIGLACALHETDYRKSGRTCAKLGLEGLDLKAMRRLILEGRPQRGRS